MNSLVQEFKYRQRFYLGRVLGQLLASAAIEQSVPRPEVLLPVPMPEDRFKDRGFNSAQIIAEVVARELALPIESHWATRLENTVALAGMSRERRQMSIRGA
ncbi:MAG: ComF family protein, partial [Gammaproteobacteria bacterium]|nr:ComF family protein [Gammaproteobacteria bacterium]